MKLPWKTLPLLNIGLSWLVKSGRIRMPFSVLFPNTFCRMTLLFDPCRANVLGSWNTARCRPLRLPDTKFDDWAVVPPMVAPTMPSRRMPSSVLAGAFATPLPMMLFWIRKLLEPLSTCTPLWLPAMRLVPNWDGVPMVTLPVLSMITPSMALLMMVLPCNVTWLVLIVWTPVRLPLITLPDSAEAVPPIRMPVVVGVVVNEFVRMPCSELLEMVYC